MKRYVVRLPRTLVDRFDRLAERATAALKIRVARATILRALVARTIDDAEHELGLQAAGAHRIAHGAPPPARADDGAAEREEMPRGRMRICTARLPPKMIERLDRLAARATAASPVKVARSGIIRALASRAIGAAEGDPSFATALGAAVLKRGRKPMARLEAA
jgi:predicted DNA-binding protein